MRGTPKDARRLLVYQTVGFLGIILLCWLDEYLSLTYRLFGGVRVDPNWREALFETGFALTIWAVVTYSMRQLLARLFYLERFVRVCAWCRKISYGDDWVPFETFLQLDSETRTSHGVCPECEANWVARGVEARALSGPASGHDH
jgi:hypothetical protein